MAEITKEQIVEFKEEESQAKDAQDYIILAESISKTLDDNDWAKKLLEEAEKLYKDHFNNISKLLNNLKVVSASFKVYGKLIARGHIYEQVEGEYFILQTELTLLGDWQNYIQYKGDDKPDQLTLNQLLSDDITLLDQFKEHSQQILRDLRGIKLLPWLIAVFLVILSSGMAWLKFGEDYLLLYEKGVSSLTKENLHLLYSPAISVALLSFKKLIIRYLMLGTHSVLWFINWAKGMFSPKTSN